MAVCVGWMQEAAPKVPKTGAEKSTKREGRGTPIRIVLLNWRCQSCALCLLQVAGQAAKSRASGRVCDASDARKQPGASEVSRRMQDQVRHRAAARSFDGMASFRSHGPLLSLLVAFLHWGANQVKQQ